MQTILVALLSTNTSYGASLRHFSASCHTAPRGMVIAEIAFAVTYAGFVNFTGASVPF